MCCADSCFALHMRHHPARKQHTSCFYNHCTKSPKPFQFEDLLNRSAKLDSKPGCWLRARTPAQHHPAQTAAEHAKHAVNPAGSFRASEKLGTRSRVSSSRRPASHNSPQGTCRQCLTASGELFPETSARTMEKRCLFCMTEQLAWGRPRKCVALHDSTVPAPRKCPEALKSALHFDWLDCAYMTSDFN